MKKIIDGKRYNTDTAILVGDHDNGRSANDFTWWKEALYLSPRKRWFIVGSGGPMTRYAHSCSDNTVSGSSDVFTLLNPDEAREWLETFGDVETIERYFEIEEG